MLNLFHLDIQQEAPDWGRHIMINAKGRRGYSMRGPFSFFPNTSQTKKTYIILLPSAHTYMPLIAIRNDNWDNVQFYINEKLWNSIFYRLLFQLYVEIMFKTNWMCDYFFSPKWVGLGRKKIIVVTENITIYIYPYTLNVVWIE